jgi:arylsulfatase A-like enzyme
MKWISLLLVFVIAKAAVLWGRPIPWDAWTIAAYVWQDVLVALAFGVVEWGSSKRSTSSRAPALLYCALVTYVALNIPIARVLSTPLTWPMLRATGGALSDSILVYVTWSHVIAVALTLGAASVLPTFAARAPKRVHRGIFAAALLLVAVGPAAAARVDTLGLHRNVVVALVTTALPRINTEAATADWREPPALSERTRVEGPLESHETDNLSHLRGIAAGRNVVLVSLESTAAQYLRLYGAAEDVTPNLDRLAENAVVFDNAYAVYPESIKGLFSILCSTYPAFDTTPAVYERAPCRSLASVLTQAGYRTALFHSGRFAYLGMQSIIQNRGFHTLQDAGDIAGNHESSFGVDEPSAVARMLSWVDALPAGERFFLHYMPIAGHHPYETPTRGPFDSLPLAQARPFATREEIGRYRNALHYGDEALGVLMDGLRARGLDQRTVWIVLGDHGEALGQHEGNYGHTFFLYDENVRVPFLIAAPGVLERPQRSRTTVSLVDTAPTILDVLGMSIPPAYQGQSALNGRPRMALFFTDYSLALVGLRDGRWKFIHELDSGRSKLFDLSRDPRETIDVSRDEPRRIAAYTRTLLAWSAAQKQHITQRME